jgi:hypothetical protein
MKVSQSFGPYNQRRYSKPWIAKITSWPVGKNKEMEFGTYLGDDNGGVVKIDANSGDIVRTGQKDYRGNNTKSNWYEVTENGELMNISVSDAREAYQLRQETETNIKEGTKIDWPAISDEQILKECQKRGLTT